MKSNYIGLLTLLLVSLAHADGASECQRHQGDYLTGTVIAGPRFKSGMFRQGVELSHTHLQLKSDQDDRAYDVAVDNVFASGYRPNTKFVPAPLSSIAVGDRLELCGLFYTRGTGIHWVHTNCGKRPTHHAPDGWIRKLSNGRTGENMESYTGFCSLWR